MREKCSICLATFVCLAILFLNSCANTGTGPFQANFTIPPKAISAEDLAKINTLRIVVRAQVESTNSSQDSTCASGILRERVASRLYQEGFYRVIDVIWGDVEGVSKAYDIAQVAQSGHGYANFNTEDFADAATLAIDFSARIQAKMVQNMETIQLKHVPYRLEDLEAKPQNIPRSIPDKERITFSEVKLPHDFLEGRATGNLTFTITAADGSEVYSRRFPVSSSFQGEISCPPDSELIADMVDQAVNQFVSDISPTKVSHLLVVNGEGDEKGVLLLKAQAYSEAIAWLESLPKNVMKPADYENLGIAFEILGYIDDAEENYQVAKCEAGLKRIEQVKNTQKSMRRMKSANDTGFKADGKK